MPVGVLCLIGMIAGNQAVNSQSSYTFMDSAFASLLTVGICATAFMGLPLTFADYRDKKILKHFFVTPVSPMLMLLVQVIIALITALLSSMLVSLIAIFVFVITCKEIYGHLLEHIFLSYFQCLVWVWLLQVYVKQ